MKRNLFLQSVGFLLLLLWVISFGEIVVKLISQIFNSEPYYFDNTFLYFLAFALAPFVLNSYIEGLNIDLDINHKWNAWQKIKFLLLSAFTLMLLFLSIAAYFAFYETFWNEKLSVQFLFLLIPIFFFTTFLFISRYLYRTAVKQ
jgi:hypothetical protein